jgi:hypothetical protein
MQGCVQHAFDPRIFDMSQQDATVTLFEGLRVAFEDVDYFLEEGLIDGVIVPDKDSAILHISADGDVFIHRRSGLLFVSHEVGAYFCGGCPLSRTIFFILHVTALLEEHQRQDVILPICVVHRAAIQDIGGFPEVTFESGEGCNRWHGF